MATTARSLDHVMERSWYASFRQMMGNALIVTRREVRDSFRDWRILAPIVILTFLFPTLAQFVASRFANFVRDYGEYGGELLGERAIPFMLMIVGFFPISISLVIALETFVGEKERRSLEPLLSTPLTNTELYIGKTLAAMIPPLLSSYGGMAVYLISLIFGETAWRPSVMLVGQILLLTTVQALVMVTGAVVVSSQTTSTRAANLLASFIIIPMTLVIQGESFVMFVAPDANSPNGIGALWCIIVGMLVVVILLLRVGNSIFNREELLSSTLDQLNLRGTLSKIRRYVLAIGDDGTRATNVIEWYRQGVTASLKRQRTALLIVAAVFIGAFIAGYLFGQIPRWQLPLLSSQDAFINQANKVPEFLTVSFQKEAMFFILWQNMRVLLGVLLLSMFTFGAASLVITPVTFAIMGYLFSQVALAGYGLDFLLGAVLTHGIVEIPVILMATAACLSLGAVATRPPRGTTVGHAWIMALADTIKLAVGVIIPGLIVAAFIEAFITPHVVLALLG